MNRKLIPTVLALALAVSALLGSSAAKASPRFDGEWAQRIAFSATADIEEFSGYLPEGNDFDLAGTIVATGAITKVEAEVYDRRSLATVATYLWEADSGEKTTAFDLKPIQKQFARNTSLYTGGEKHLTVTAWSGTESCTVIDRYYYVNGDNAPVRNVTALCEIDCVPQCDRNWVTARSGTGWIPRSGEDAMTVTLPSDRICEGVTLTWRQPPTALAIEFYGKDGEPVGEVNVDAGGFIPRHFYFTIPQGARLFRMRSPEGNGTLIEMWVLEEGLISEAVQRWEETAEDWNLMLVSCHQDDEHIFFGATIPRYVTEGREVGVVYMADCGEDRYREALDGLWAAGLRHYPVFLGYEDGLEGSLSYAYRKWGGYEAVLATLVSQIRSYKPEVVVTHDLQGEYGHYQHRATAHLVADAVQKAADPLYTPTASEDLPAWQVLKCYLHLYGRTPTLLDWSEPIRGFGGMTGLEISQMCYSKHRSQQELVSYRLGLKFSNSEFGLYTTTVGPDTKRDDFFEHID